MPLAKKETEWYIKRLYRFLKDGHEIEFKKMVHRRGYIDDPREDEKTKCSKVYVALDHRDRVLSTLIHEFLHFEHPEWCETDIYTKESALINSLSNKQIKNIIKRFADAL